MKTLQAHFKALAPDEPVWVAVSGGADSVCLLYQVVDAAAGFDCHVVHVNHRLRGSDANADEAFVRELCAELSVPLHVHRERPKTRSSVSLEMAGRELRHRVFRACLRTRPAQAVLLGHHLDDNVETIIMRRQRQPDDPRWNIQGDVTIRRGGEELRLLRPLLHWPKTEILNWLADRGLAFREDASNADRSFLRNRIRHEILPGLDLKKKRNIVSDASLLRERDQYFEIQARKRLQELLGENGLDFEAFFNEPLAVRRKMALELLGHEEARRAMKFARGEIDLDFKNDWVKEEGPVLTQWTFNTAKVNDPTIEEPVRLAVPGSTDWGPWRFAAAMGAGFRAERRPFEAWIRPGNAVLVRPWRAGDRMRPLGMDGTRKLQDVLTDLKIPAAQKRVWPVVIDAAGEVLWVPGFRIADSAAVPGPDTPSLHLAASGPFVDALHEAGFGERGFAGRGAAL